MSNNSDANWRRLQEREGEPRVDRSRRAGLHVGAAEHLQPDPTWTEGPGCPRFPPVQREGAAVAQPRGAAAGISAPPP